MYIQYPQLLPIFLSDLNILKKPEEVEQQFKSMSPNESSIVFVSNINSPEFAKKCLSAKYIEMELGIQNMENIKLIMID